MTEKEEHKESTQKDSNESIDSSLGSILFSVFLVVLAIGFVFSFKYFLTGDLARRLPIPGLASKGMEEGTQGEGRMDEDHNFKYQYITVGGLDGKELYATREPDILDDSARKMKEGQIVGVKKRGYIDGQLYYQLNNGLYLKGDKSIIPLKEFVRLTGYVSITYISSSGVRLHKWADFDADNVVGSVYVGDKVNIRAKIITVGDLEAFVTSEGYYMTTNSRYMNDHTTVVRSLILGENRDENSTEESTDSGPESNSETN